MARNGYTNVLMATPVLDDCRPFALRIKGVRGGTVRARSRHFSSLPACFGWWSGFKPGGFFGRIWDKYGYHWPVYLERLNAMGRLLWISFLPKFWPPSKTT